MNDVMNNRLTMNLEGGKPKRDSGIELLKVFAIFCIVVSHMVQSLSSETTYIMDQSYIIDLKTASTNICLLFIACLLYLGGFGNTIFFVSTAWFLADSNKVNSKKWCLMLADVWVLSVIFLIVATIIDKGKIDMNILIRSIIPVTIGDYWYITCYLLFYPIHTYLNHVIGSFDKRMHLKAIFATSVPYLIIGFIRELFFTSSLIIWITVYIIITYLKRYYADKLKNVKINILLFLVGFICNTGIICITNYLGLHIGFFNDKVLYWASNCNPFNILMAVGLFGIFKQLENFKSTFINYLSSLSLIVYVLHNNLIFKRYYRPLYFSYIHARLGYEHIVFWIATGSIVLFVLSIFLAFVYDKTVRRMTKKISEIIYTSISKLYSKVENKLLKI